MAATFRFNVYAPKNEYVAACKYASDAAAIVGIYGYGATVRIGRSVKYIVWSEGEEEYLASDSYDYAAALIEERATWKQ